MSDEKRSVPQEDARVTVSTREFVSLSMEAYRVIRNREVASAIGLGFAFGASFATLIYIWIPSVAK